MLGAFTLLERNRAWQSNFKVTTKPECDNCCGSVSAAKSVEFSMKY